MKPDGAVVIRRACAAAITVLAAASLAEACNVPVFRYALENWAPDKYRGVLFHRGPLEPQHQEQLSRLQERAGAAQLNLSLRTVDIDESIPASDVALFTSLGDAELPRLVVQYPAALQLDEPVWSGAFDVGALSQLTESPARKEVLQRLSSGQTAVWLMIDSGDAAQDEAAAATLAEQLASMKQTLKLPELTDSPEDAIQDGPALRIEFSLVRIRRNDAAEQALVRLLLAAESDLVTLTEPMVFPIFGRGRAMLPLVGAGIAAENIRDSAKFLTGACSCQVKELNPGFDLLAAADWRELLPWASRPAVGNLGKIGSPVSSEPELVPIPTGTSPQRSDVNRQPQAAQPVAAAQPKTTQWDWTVVLFPALFAGLMIVIVVAASRRPRG